MQSDKNEQYFQIFKNQTNIIRDQIQNGEQKPSLLLHVCCAPCSSAVIEQLEKLFTITLLFYNPNIFPQTEYERRRDELIRFIKEVAHSNITVVEIPYIPQEFYSAVFGLENEREKGTRCFACYELRLAKTAEYANRENFKYFTTTLSISPHKDAKKINELGIKSNAAFIACAETEKATLFLPADFKKENGYKRSLELSAHYKLYRQTYCGCEFSQKKF